jgi:archaellum component FlaF (FlaF/FlaG flagellin family)
LGTQEHPFKQIDDAFRELLNRKTILNDNNSDFNVTIYIRGLLPKNISELRVIANGIG